MNRIARLIGAKPAPVRVSPLASALAALGVLGAVLGGALQAEAQVQTPKKAEPKPIPAKVVAKPSKASAVAKSVPARIVAKPAPMAAVKKVKSITRVRAVPAKPIKSTEAVKPSESVKWVFPPKPAKPAPAKVSKTVSAQGQAGLGGSKVGVAGTQNPAVGGRGFFGATGANGKRFFGARAVGARGFGGIGVAGQGSGQLGGGGFGGGLSGGWGQAIAAPGMPGAASTGQSSGMPGGGFGGGGFGGGLGGQNAGATGFGGGGFGGGGGQNAGATGLGPSGSFGTAVIPGQGPALGGRGFGGEAVSLPGLGGRHGDGNAFNGLEDIVISVDHDKATIDVTDASFAAVVRRLAKLAKMSVVIGRGAYPDLTMVLSDMSPKAALDALIRAGSASYRLESGVYYIQPLQPDPLNPTRNGVRNAGER